MMAALRAYFDDSGKENDPQHELITVAGYVGSVEQWAAAEAAWVAALAECDIPYLHMKVFAHGRPPFERLHNKPDDAFQILRRLILVIRESGLSGVGAVVRLAHINRFNKEMGLRLDALSIAMYGAVLELHQKRPGQAIEVIVDRIEKPYQVFGRVEAYGKTDNFYKGCVDCMTFAQIPKTASFKTMPSIQMADLAAWETRRAHSLQTPWFEAERPSDHEKWMSSLRAWQLREFGRFPVERTSFGLLVGAAGLDGIVWTYDTFKNAHEARGGAWVL